VPAIEWRKLRKTEVTGSRNRLLWPVVADRLLSAERAKTEPRCGAGSHVPPCLDKQAKLCPIIFDAMQQNHAASEAEDQIRPRAKYSVPEAQVHLGGISRWLIWDLRRRGELKSLRIGRKKIVFLGQHLIDYLTSCEQGGPPPDPPERSSRCR
jgi:hypothetical protein